MFGKYCFGTGEEGVQRKSLLGFASRISLPGARSYQPEYIHFART